MLNGDAAIELAEASAHTSLVLPVSAGLFREQEPRSRHCGFGAGSDQAAHIYRLCDAAGGQQRRVAGHLAHGRQCPLYGLDAD